MPNQLFEIFAPADLKVANERAFGLRCKHFFASSVETLHPSIGLLIRDGYLDHVRDTPNLRTWMWSVRRLQAALKEDDAALPMEALSHLCLDEARGTRLAELLALQLVGILAGQASREGRNFDFQADLSVPGRIDFDGLGSLVTPAQGKGRRFRISVSSGTLSVDADQWSCELPSTPDGGSFKSALEVVNGTSLGYVYASLCRPEFQPFPQLQGLPGNEGWVTQLRRCWKALELAGLPHVREHLGWCKSLIGLVSMTGAIGSASREEALGLVYVPVGAGDVDLAECLLHESLHQVLFRLEEAVSLFDEGSPSASTYFSPWRTDGRPLRMVLHGAFVFAGVARLHRLWSEKAESDVVDSRATACRRAVESQQALDTVLRHAKLSRVGERVASAIQHELQDVLAGCEPHDAIRSRVQMGKKRDALSALLS